MRKNTFHIATEDYSNEGLFDILTGRSRDRDTSSHDLRLSEARKLIDRDIDFDELNTDVALTLNTRYKDLFIKSGRFNTNLAKEARNALDEVKRGYKAAKPVLDRLEKEGLAIAKKVDKIDPQGENCLEELVALIKTIKPFGKMPLDYFNVKPQSIGDSKLSLVKDGKEFHFQPPKEVSRVNLSTGGIDTLVLVNVLRDAIEFYDQIDEDEYESDFVTFDLTDPPWRAYVDELSEYKEIVNIYPYSMGDGEDKATMLTHTCKEFTETLTNAIATLLNQIIKNQ